MHVVELRDLYFAYDEKIILENINLTVENGEFLSLIGPNGSGKSTLVKLMLGLLHPDRGRVFLFDVCADRFREWHRVGYVSQRPALDSRFPATVREVAATGRFGRAGLCRRLRQDDWECVDEALEMAGLLPLGNRPLLELSGGQQQRAFIARALAGDPDILILDEPQTGLDDRYLSDFYRLLQQLNRERGITVILVSHDVDAVGSMANRVACLNGSLVCLGTPQDVLTPGNLSCIYGAEYSAAAGLQ